MFKDLKIAFFGNNEEFIIWYKDIMVVNYDEDYNDNKNPGRANYTPNSWACFSYKEICKNTVISKEALELVFKSLHNINNFKE